MTDRKQFEAMLEALINKDQETAKEIFHNIVVAKSREIYEELLAEDFSMEEEFPPADDESEEPTDDEHDTDASADADDSDEDEFGSNDEDEGEDMSDDDQTARILDLEDALDELKAEFDQLMADEDGEGEHNGTFGGDDMGGNEFGSELDEPVDEFMMEYTTPVGGNTYNKFGKMGDNGVNTKSIVAKPNKMGGTAANIVNGGTEKSPVEANKGQLRGNGVFKGSTPKLQDAGNVNVPGGKGATKLSTVSGGHGAEKKGTGEQAPNKKSIIGSRG